MPISDDALDERYLLKRRKAAVMIRHLLQAAKEARVVAVSSGAEYHIIGPEILKSCFVF